MFKRLILIPALLLAVLSYAQNPRIDSLKKELNKQIPDSVRLRVLIDLNAAYTTIDPNIKMGYARAALALALKLHDEQRAADAEIGIGTAYSVRSQLDSAVYWYKQGYERSNRIGYLQGMGRSLNNTGFAYDKMDNSRASLKYYLEALPIFKKLKFDKGTNQTSINIGSIYYDLKQYRLAISYYQPCYENYLAAGDEDGIGYALLTLANCFTQLGDYRKAETYLNKSLAIRQTRADSNGIALVYKGFGVLRTMQKRPVEAILMLEKSYHMVKALQDMYEEAAVLLDVTDAYLMTGQLAEAEAAALKALSNSRAIKTSLGISESLDKLVRVYRRRGNIEKAFHYQTEYVAAQDSLQKRKALQDLTLIEYERIRNENADLQRDNGGLLTRLQHYSNGVVLLVVILLAVLSLLLLQYRRSRERRKANQLLKAQKEEIEHINQVKNKLFSIVSHDLRGPIANLQMLFGLYRAGALTGEELKDLLARLEENIAHTSTFLDNLLEWSRNQLEGMEAHPSNIQLVPILQKNMALVQERIRNKNLEITLESGAPVTAFADAHLIDLVVRNLLGNAIKFCKAGDKINLSVTTAKGKAIIKIADTGPGISLAEQERLFLLDQTVTAGSHGEKGSHLGLILCKDAVEKNNGQLRFESAPGAGTTFWVELPLMNN